MKSCSPWGKNAIMLPFQIRCDDFEASFYDTGAPKEYRSDLTIIDKGQEVLKQSIRVNDPLSYQGVTFYQASYGAMLKQAEIELQDRDSGTLAQADPALPGGGPHSRHER